MTVWLGQCNTYLFVASSGLLALALTAQLYVSLSYLYVCVEETEKPCISFKLQCAEANGSSAGSHLVFSKTAKLNLLYFSKEFRFH